LEKKGMKAIKISEDIHSKLTGLLGELTAQTNKMQTYQDAINALLEQSIMLPSEVIAEAENFIEENKHLGYTTKEDFVRDAIRRRLEELKTGNEFIEVPRDQYDELNEAVKEMGTSFRSAEQFINSKINEVLEKYEEYKIGSKAED
jgi:metal-responsive CopG/Arc/MetJ family transcriptional regulator